MSSLAQERAMLALSYAESLSISLKEWYRIRKRKSEQLSRLIELLAQESDRCITYYPMPKSIDEVKHMEIKVTYLNDWINKKNGTTAPIGTSLVLGLIVDLASYVKPDSPKGRSIERMISLLKQIHRYFDRNGDREEDYEKAWKAIEIHERLLKARVRKRKSAKNMLKQAWWLEFENGETVEVKAA